jgi:hypothetical protein
MSNLQEDKEIIGLEKKLKKRDQEGFLKETRDIAQNAVALKAKLSELSIYRHAIKTTMKLDDKLIEARAEVTKLKAPYTQDLKLNDEKSRFIALLLEENFGESK